MTDKEKILKSICLPKYRANKGPISYYDASFQDIGNSITIYKSTGDYYNTTTFEFDSDGNLLSIN